MAKAADSLRRSSVKLKALGSGHRDLQLVISEQKAARHEFKNFIRVQKTAADYLQRWAQNEDNDAIQSTVSALTQLSTSWNEVEKELSEQLKQTTMAFDRVLEEEKAVDQARKNLDTCQRKEQKVQKELDKLHKKGEDASAAEQKLDNAVRARELADSELQGRHREAEANKQNMVRQGLQAMAEAHVTMARKCSALFQTYSEICQAIPVRHPREQAPPPFTAGSKVDSLASSTIRLLPTAQISSSSSGDRLSRSMEESPPSYRAVASSHTSAPSTLQRLPSASAVSARSENMDGGWDSDEFDD